MRTPAPRRLFVVVFSLVAAALGCARADVLISPVTPDFATRQPPTPTSTAAPPTPTATVPSPTPAPDTATPEAPPTSAGYPAPTSAPTEVEPTVALPTTVAPTEPAAAATPVPPTAALPTQAPPTATNVPPTIAPQSFQPVPIPADATFTQQMVVTGEGGDMIGDGGYLIDNRVITWAALEGGHTAWVFDLGSVQKIAGVRVYAQKPRGGEPTTLLAIEASNDGQNWQPVLVGSGDCGEPQCDLIPQMTFTDIGFNPVSARYLRMRSGPNRFGFAEVSVAILP